MWKEKKVFTEDRWLSEVQLTSVTRVKTGLVKRTKEVLL